MGCKTDSTQKYILYTPGSFPGNLQWPVIICFDPHADGKKPVELLRAFSDREGYILVASLEVKNGLANAEYSVNCLINEIKAQYPIDQNRIYLLGFSGGGRMALAAGMSVPGIRGIITCSAGIPGYQPPRDRILPDIYATAGDGDFNYREVEALSSQFRNLQNKTFTRISHGTHAWPSSAELSRAMLWMHCRAAEYKLTSKNKTSLEAYRQELMDSVSLAMSLQDPMEASNLCSLGISMFDGLESVDDFRELQQKIQSDRPYREYMVVLKQISIAEEKLSAEYLKAFSEKDYRWWQNEISVLNKHRRSSEHPARIAMYNRLFGYLSIVAYSYSNQSLQSGNREQAQRFVTIYGIIDPENEDYHAFKEMLEAK
jgi:hypothetical protein